MGWHSNKQATRKGHMENQADRQICVASGRRAAAACHLLVEQAVQALLRPYALPQQRLALTRACAAFLVPLTPKRTNGSAGRKPIAILTEGPLYDVLCCLPNKCTEEKHKACAHKTHKLHWSSGTGGKSCKQLHGTWMMPGRPGNLWECMAVQKLAATDVYYILISMTPGRNLNQALRVPKHTFAKYRQWLQNTMHAEASPKSVWIATARGIRIQCIPGHLG